MRLWGDPVSNNIPRTFEISEHEMRLLMKYIDHKVTCLCHVCKRLDNNERLSIHGIRQKAKGAL